LTVYDGQYIRSVKIPHEKAFILFMCRTLSTSCAPVSRHIIPRDLSVLSASPSNIAAKARALHEEEQRSAAAVFVSWPSSTSFGSLWYLVHRLVRLGATTARSSVSLAVVWVAALSRISLATSQLCSLRPPRHKPSIRSYQRALTTAQKITWMVTIPKICSWVSSRSFLR